MNATPPRQAIVSGASSGIGETICRRLLREGWQVTGLSRRAPAWQDPGYQHRSIDLADTSAIPTALEGLSADAIIHAAGMMRAAPLGSLDPAVVRHSGGFMWKRRSAWLIRWCRGFLMADAFC